jgi:hypothetical protein
MSLRGPVGDEAISTYSLLKGDCFAPLAMTVIKVFQSQFYFFCSGLRTADGGRVDMSQYVLSQSVFPLFRLIFGYLNVPVRELCSLGSVGGDGVLQEIDIIPFWEIGAIVRAPALLSG